MLLFQSGTKRHWQNKQATNLPTLICFVIARKSMNGRMQKRPSPSLLFSFLFLTSRFLGCEELMLIVVVGVSILLEPREGRWVGGLLSLMASQYGLTIIDRSVMRCSTNLYPIGRVGHSEQSYMAMLFLCGGWLLYWLWVRRLGIHD